MYIYIVKDRNKPLLAKLQNIWKASVIETHTFLSTAEIEEIEGYLLEALTSVTTLIVASNNLDEPIAFMGIHKSKIDILFISPIERGKGIGKKLFFFGRENFDVNEVNVNEQNPQAVGFYEHLSFSTYNRSELDEQGNPYPLLYMRLKDKCFKQENKQWIQIEITRLILRGHKMEDFPEYWNMLNEDKGREFTGGITKLSYEERKVIFQQQCESFGKENDYEFAVERKSDQAYLGYCGMRYHEQLQCMELLYGFPIKHWGKGYASEAAKAALGFGCNVLYLLKIIAFANPLHLATQHVLKKIGMKESGNIKLEDGSNVILYTYECK